jgi:ABC-type sugar transport system ATPase subunit
LSRRIPAKYLSGRKRSISERRFEARIAGIAAVYQDPKLFAHLDVAENIFMGAYPTTLAGTVDRKTTYLRAKRALHELGLDLDPRSLIAGLSMAELQFVEIARALVADLQLLILDEPTSALTPAESGRLFKIIRTLPVEKRARSFQRALHCPTPSRVISRTARRRHLLYGILMSLAILRST